MKKIYTFLMMKIITFFTSKEMIAFTQKLVKEMFNSKKTGEEKKAYVFKEIKNKFSFSSSDVNWAIETILKYLKARFQGDRYAE